VIRTSFPISSPVRPSRLTGKKKRLREKKKRKGKEEEKEKETETLTNRASFFGDHHRPESLCDEGKKGELEGRGGKKIESGEEQWPTLLP